MAPALTEPISPTEKLTKSAVTATTTPGTRSSRKIESLGIKSSNSSILKQSQQLRDKRSVNSSVAQTPTSSIRLTRSRDIQQKNTGSSLSQSTPRKSFKTSCGVSTNNEQMGLSTAPLEKKTQIRDKDTSSASAEFEAAETNTKEDTSTAQLLADLTNEAITAEICLRNQLKDVNLVKVSEDPSSPLQRDNDIVVIKAIAASPSTALENKDYTAHMEAQCNEKETKSTPVQDSYRENKQFESETETQTVGPLLENQQSKEQQRTTNDVKGDQKHDKVEPLCHGSTNVDMENVSGQESPVGSPDYDTETKKDDKDTSKAEILSVEELPPVNTDSTMTASEVEDNLEERLSQLDGTAIDSPPPNSDVDTDVTMKNSHIVEVHSTPPRTPIHQHSISQDMQQIQQQLQNTPPTPVSMQVQAHHIQQQQQNCFTPQSTSSLNTVGSGNIPSSFIKESEGGDLEDQDIEEVFKVLKGFEGGTTSDLNVCDLNVLFNEVYMKMNESEINGNSGSVVQSHSNVTTNPSIQLVKPTELEEGQKDIEKRQQQMQRKVDFLMRRLRKLQSRYMCKHACEEIAGLFEYSSRHSNKGVSNSIGNSSSCPGTGNTDLANQDPSKYFLKVIAARPPATDWRGEQEITVPATQITTLLRKIETVANAQQHCITPTPTTLINLSSTKKNKKALMENTAPSTACATTATLAEGRAEDVVVPTFEENVTEELTQVAGLLQSEICEVQRAIDSDATESSSGGESADEMVNYNNQQQQTLPITKRAAWRYSRDRAAIASRWSWLLSQISDLEIKIRQHSELHQEIVRSKGQVTSASENSVKLDCNVAETDNENLAGSCRTRGFIPTQFRKRKLIQTTNIHTISKKAARPSTIKCGCQWPLHPCALCTGRLDPTAPRDLPDTMMMSDRIALLDSGYHPVLSFRENVNNALHFEAIAKQPEWQQRVLRCQVKSIAKNIWKAERQAAAAAAGGYNSSRKCNSDTVPTKRRYVKKKDREDKSAGSNPALQTKTTMSSTDGVSSQILTSSLIDAGNGTATLSTTSTTPLVANKAVIKNAKKQQLIVADEKLRDLDTISSPLVSTNVVAMSHQMTDYHPINYDQYNLNQTLSSSISNSSSSKINKHRKLSSASMAVNSHHYNYHNNNHLYNGDANYLQSHDWSAAIGSIDSVAVRSRTSSPTHITSYHKNEKSFDRKNRVSYDIDNIVIPYSVAAATRVEILPYKEIPTPKWRIINIDGEETSKEDVPKIEKEITPNGDNKISDKPTILESIQNEEDIPNGVKSCVRIHSKDNDNVALENVNYIDEKSKSVLKDDINNTNCHDDENIKEPDSKKVKVDKNVIDSQPIQVVDNGGEISYNLNEDISDDAMISRHERALTEERRKFQTFLKFPWSTRSRANRRIDSRAESSGANTPDPSSPAPHTPSVGGCDQESIPSPSTPSTPLNAVDTISEAGDNSTSFLGVGFLGNPGNKRQERRRTTSTKRDRDLERRSSTPDSKELITPYEPMKFPLNDEQFEELMRAMPSEHNEESKRFDECYLPGGGTKSQIRSVYTGGRTSKRSSRSSTCLERRVKGPLKNISTDDNHILMTLENGTDLLYDEEYEDDYPKHHLAPNDDHLTADNCVDSGGNIDEHNDLYGNPYDAYSRRQQKPRNHDSDGDSTETEPFQDDDPNDPEWKGESEDRLRKKM